MTGACSQHLGIRPMFKELRSIFMPMLRIFGREDLLNFSEIKIHFTLINNLK